MLQRRMDIDANSLLAGLFVSSIGFVLFMYGRKMNRVPHLGAGLILLVYPYFVPGALWILAIAACLLALLWGAIRMGY
jgi:hypothetical protein